MQSHQKEIVKDITSGSQLENELQISQAQHGVAVLDVYNAEWGSAKVLNEAFRRLHTDAGDLVHLRFFSVECNSVLESLKAPQEAKAVQRPKTAINYERDTFPSFWSPILEGRCQHSKPFFVFFKEGKMRDTIEGIDTPKICKYIQDLCKQQNPITEYINNADLLQFWQKYFSPYENEVNWSSFVSALRKEGYPTDDVTMGALAAATNAEAKVDVTNVQTWLGESATLREKITELEGAAAHEPPPPEEKAPEPPQEEEAHKERELGEPTKGDEDEWREMDEEKHGEPPAEAKPEEGEEEGATPPPPPPEEAPRELPEGQEQAEGEPKDGGDEWREMDEEKHAEPPAEEAPVEEEPRELPTEHEQAEEVPPPPPAPEEPPQEGEDEWREMDEEKAAEAPVEEQHEEGAVEAVEDGAHGIHESDEHRELGDEEEHNIKRTEYVTETKEINQIYLNGWVTVSDEEMHVWNAISEVPLHYPVRTTPMLRPRDEVTDVDVPSAETLDTLAQYMEKQGVPPTSINMVCLAADQKIGSESLSYGKAALVLISGETDNIQELFPQLAPLHSDLSDGALLQKDAPVAGTTMCLCASQVYADEAFYYPLKEDEGAQFAACTADQELVLSALTPLMSKRPDDDSLKVRIAGMPKVIELASTDEGAETVVLSQWHAVLKVTENSDDVLSLQFVEYVAADAFQEFVTAYTERLMEDENKIERKTGTAEDNAEEDEEIIEEATDEM